MTLLNVVHTDAALRWPPGQHAKAVAAIRRLAAKITPHEPPMAKSAAFLLSAMHHDRPDHIALAISAHRLLVTSVARDIKSIGQADPPQAELLTQLCCYLDAEGWNVGSEGRFWPADDRRRLG
jgi:hypothetical protein